MVCIGYLFKTYRLIMVGTVGAVGITAGIYQYLALFLVGYLFKSLEVIVEVIVDNDDVVIPFELLVKLFGVGDALAGGACELVVRVVLSDVVL